MLRSACQSALARDDLRTLAWKSWSSGVARLHALRQSIAAFCFRNPAQLQTSMGSITSYGHPALVASRCGNTQKRIRAQDQTSTQTKSPAPPRNDQTNRNPNRENLSTVLVELPLVPQQGSGANLCCQVRLASTASRKAPPAKAPPGLSDLLKLQVCLKFK